MASNCERGKLQMVLMSLSQCGEAILASLHYKSSGREKMLASDNFVIKQPIQRDISGSQI